MRVRRKSLERQGHLGWLTLTELEGINSKLGEILLILTKMYGEEE
jgi:hypothetical protein